MSLFRSRDSDERRRTIRHDLQYLAQIDRTLGNQVLARVPELERDVTGMAEQLAGPGAGTAGELQDAARRPERVERVSQLGAAGKVEALVQVVRGQGTVVGTLSGQKLILN